MKIKQALREYLLEIEIRKYTPKAIRSYRNNLNLFVKFMEEEEGVTEVEDIFANAQRARYGRSSEKKTYVLNEDQLSLFNEAEKCQTSKAEEPTEETFTVKAHARKKKRTIDELTKNLPVEEVVIDLPESRMICDKCGSRLRLIGRKLIRREMIIIPQQEKILEYYSCTYACDKCERDTGFAHILTTKTPPPLMKHPLRMSSWKS
ncbi:MAG: IS66 family transposase zinc-finger binding domain-containing protein [Candidatus Onthomonas sp.]